jgi:hypothetical protein
MYRSILATFVLYQLVILCCRATRFSHRPFNESSTWKLGDDPLEGLELPFMQDIPEPINHNPLDNWKKNNVWWPHDQVDGVESEISNFLTSQHYQTQNRENKGKMLEQNTFPDD